MTPAGFGSHAIARAVFASLVAAHLLLVTPPWRFFVPAPGLDASWQQVIAHAAESGWQWGTDIAFTYGPLGFLRSPPFDDALIAEVLAWNAFFVTALIVGIVRLLRGVPLAPAAALYALVAFAASGRANQGAFALLPLLAGLLHFHARGPATGVSLLLVIAAGACASVYVPYLALGLALSAVIDADRLRERRPPPFTLAFAASTFGAFLLAGQAPAAFPHFLRSAFEFANGYADAMGLEGNGYETIAFLATSAAALALVLASEWPRLADRRRRPGALMVLVGLAAFWFLAWKSGFVRHDGHSVGGWRSLAAALAAYAAARWSLVPSRALRSAMIVVAFASCCGAVYPIAGEVTPSRVWTRMVSLLVDAPLRAAEQMLSALRDPREWAAGQRRAADESSARLRRALPDLVAPGTVDLVGLDQGTLLAHGVDYRPQPVFQAFAAYTPWLVDLNRRHLRSERAARTLFLTSATIDNRYPLSDLGPAVADLLARYQPAGPAGEYVRWRLRDSPVAIALADDDAVDTVLGEWVPVRGRDAAVVLRADVRPSTLGHLARLVVRLPGVTVSVRLADGSERAHRIVPAIAAEGFLLSPYADSAAILAAQATGRLPAGHATRVVAVRIDSASPSARGHFVERTRVRLARLVVPAPSGDAIATDPAR